MGTISYTGFHPPYPTRTATQTTHLIFIITFNTNKVCILEASDTDIPNLRRFT